MDRRSFIKLTAVTGTTATLASCGNPENQLIRFVPDDTIVPGIAEWKPSICPLCASGCGLTVRVMQADAEVVRNGQRGVMQIAAAKKLEGDPAHPANRGKLCSRGQAAIQVTYHPDRIAQPLKREGARGTGRLVPTTWDDAIAVLTARLDALSDRASLALLIRGGRTHRHLLAARFLERFGAPAPIVFDVFADDVLRKANGMSFGREQLPTFDRARARFVLSFGADFLGTWNAPVAHAVAYGEMRRGRTGMRGAFAQVEPRMSQTGANADHWIPAKPGTDGALALGLARVLMSAHLLPAAAAGRAGGLIEGWSSGLAEYTPGRVETLTGVPAARIERLARQLAELRPAVAIVGGAPLAQTNGLQTALAVNALNALLGNVGQPGGMFFTPQEVPVTGSTRTIHRVASDILSGTGTPVQLLLVDGANPVFGTPRAWKVREALERVPFIASFGSFVDDTSALADLILPDHSFLESWVDAMPESGALEPADRMAAPVMRPLHETRATPDVLLDVGRRLKQPVELPWRTFEELLKTPGDLVTPTPAVLRSGAGTTEGRNGAGSSGPVRLAEPEFDGDPQQFPFHFLPYPSSVFADGSVAHLPWLQEMPDPMTSAMWSTWVEINPQTAERAGIADGDLVEVSSGHGSLRAPAIVSPGVAPDVIAMPVGQGHQTFTRYASGRGSNPIAILAGTTERETGALAWAATRVRIARVSDPDGSLILFAGGMREHPHEHEER